jgi:CBS domain-containing protein
LTGQDSVLTASNIMVDFISVTPMTSVYDALKLMFGAKSRVVIVLCEGKLAGIATTYDFVTKVPWGRLPLENLKVKDIMTQNASFVHPEDDLKHVVDLIYHRDIRFAPVVVEEEVVGLISRRELARIFAERFGAWYRVGDLMTYRYTTATIHESLGDVYRKMVYFLDKYVIILSGEAPVGVITPWDILQHLYQTQETSCEHHLREVMTHKPFIVKANDKCDKVAKAMIDKDITGAPVAEEQLGGLIRFKCFLKVLDV